MNRIDITEGLEESQGAFTGQWFDSDVADHFHPQANRGAPLILWRTHGGAWVLTSGNPTKIDGRRAVLVTSARAAAVLASWGRDIPPELSGEGVEL